LLLEKNIIFIVLVLFSPFCVHELTNSFDLGQS
jgi:hypothetical protein